MILLKSLYREQTVTFLNDSMECDPWNFQISCWIGFLSFLHIILGERKEKINKKVQLIYDSCCDNEGHRKLEKRIEPDRK